MSDLESRIPAGGLLACAVAATLALPLVVAGGLPPKVRSTVGPDFGEVRVFAPGSVTPNLLPRRHGAAVVAAAGGNALSVAGRLVLLPGFPAAGRTRTTFLERLLAREGYGAVGGELERAGETTADHASRRDRPGAPREAPTPTPRAKPTAPAAPAAPATPAAPRVPSIPTAGPSMSTNDAAAPAPTAADEPVAGYRAPTTTVTQKPKRVETKKPPKEPQTEKAPKEPKASEPKASEPKDAQPKAPKEQPNAPKDEPEAGKPHSDPAPAPAAPAVASTETGTPPGTGPGKTKDPTRGKEKQPEADRPAEAPAERAAAEGRRGAER